MFTTNKQVIVLACAAFSLLLSACQSPPPAATPSILETEPAAAVPTPDDLIKGMLVYGEGRLGNLAGEDEFWAFEGQEGDVVDISMISASADMDPTFSLIGPSNELLNTVYSDNAVINYEARLNCFELPESGRYVIVASTYHADLMAGSYILTVENTSEGTTEEEPAPLVLGETASNVGCGRQIETWSYEGEAGQLIWLQITADGESSSVSEFGGEIDLSVEESTGASDAVYELARFSNESELDVIYVLSDSAGYTITVDMSQAEEAQNYQIRLNFAAGDYYYGGGYVPAGELQVLSLNYPGIGVYPLAIDTEGGATVSISAFAPDYPQCGDDLRIALSVIGPEGQIIAQSSDSETVTLQDFPIAPEGTVYFPMGETDTYHQYRLEQLALQDPGQYWLALTSLLQGPMYPDDCSYFALSIEYLEQ